MGVFSTSQFLGAFVGGAGGGWLLQHIGAGALAVMSIVLAAAWWLLVWRAPADARAVEGTPRPVARI
jgi:predicted MFS family arabinose efflux permease